MSQRIKAKRVGALTEVLLIGIDAYEDTRLPPLKYASTSMEHLASALTDPTGCGIPPQQVCVLGRGGIPVSKADVLDALTSISSRGNSEKMLLIMFAGHGVEIENLVCLCASDSYADDTESCITADDISDTLESADYHGVLMITDSCRGGGFAEMHPRFFQSRRSRGFRIILSSATRSQNSYEFAALEGTVFSKVLIDVCAGRIVVGDRPGEIYFSQLLQSLGDGIEEDGNRAGRSAFPQNPIFFGSYGSDPLLFLHRDLTFGEIELRREKYSAKYVRQKLVSAMTIAVAGVSLVIGYYYAYIDTSKFVSRDDNYLTVYHGHYRLTGFGLPSLVWQSDIPAAAYSPLDGLDRYPLTNKQASAPWESILANTKSPYRELMLIRRGRSDDARKGLITYLNKEDSTDAMIGAAAQLFSEVAQVDDISFLKKLFSVPRNDVRIGAIEGLLRVDLKNAYAVLLGPGVPYGDLDFVRRLLQSLTVYQAGATEAVLDRILREGTYLRSQNPVFAVAHRLGANLSNEALWQELTDPRILYDDSLVLYLKASGRTVSFLTQNREAVLRAMESSDDYLAKSRILFVLSRIENNYLQIDFTPYLDSQEQIVASAAAVAAISHGQLKIGEVSDQTIHDEFFLEQYEERFEIDAAFAQKILDGIDPKNEGLGTAGHKLNLLLGALDERAIPTLVQLANYEDPNDISGPFQSYAIRELARLSAEFDVYPWTNHESLEVAEAALEFVLERNPSEGERLLLKRLRSIDAEVARSVFLRHRISESGMQELRKIVPEQSEASVVAAQILAVHGNLQDLDSLLTNPLVAIREAALDYILASNHFPDIAVQIENGSPQYSPEVVTKLAGYQEWQSLIDTAFAKGDRETSEWVVASALDFSDAPSGAILYFQRRTRSNTPSGGP